MDKLCDLFLHRRIIIKLKFLRFEFLVYLYYTNHIIIMKEAGIEKYNFSIPAQLLVIFFIYNSNI